MRRVAAAACCAALLLTGCQDDTAPDSAGPPAPSSPSPLPTASAEELGFDGVVLDRLAGEAKAAGSSCFLVARDGKIAGEWYWHGGAQDKPQEVFSVTKSVTSTLVGIAQAEGDLDLDDRAAEHIPQWRGTPSRRVTLRNLLSNDSGRLWSQLTDYVALLRARDRTAYAVGLAQAEPPGRVWAYNNAAIQALDQVIRTATGTDPASYAQEKLFDPVGMASTRMTTDASGKSTQMSFGMQSTCADLARFGQLFAQGGEWDGEEIVPSSWVEDAVGGSSQELNAAYGLLWWVNRPGPVREPLDAENPGLPPGVTDAGQLVPGAPEDLYAALGFGGQVVLVDPGSDTVVVRLGVPGNGSDRDAYTVADAARVVTEASAG